MADEASAKEEALAVLDGFAFEGADAQEVAVQTPAKGKRPSKRSRKQQDASGNPHSCTEPKAKCKRLRQATEVVASDGKVLVHVLCTQCRRDAHNQRQMSLSEIMKQQPTETKLSDAGDSLVDLVSDEENCTSTNQDQTVCQRCRRSLVVGNMSVTKKGGVGKFGCPFSLRLKQYKRNAVETHAEWQLTDSEALALMRAPCALCGVPADPQGGRPNGITRCRSIENAFGMGPYCSGNVSTACSTCNLIKGIHTLQQAFKICCTIATHRCLGDFGSFPECFRNNISRRSRSCYLGDTARKSVNGTAASKTHSLSNKEFNQIVSKPCHFCGKASDPPHHYNGLDRLDNSLRVYTSSNSVSCCGTCNMAKGKLTEEFFLQQCVKIAMRLPADQPEHTE